MAINPKGFHSVTPYLIVPDVAAALDLYGKALGITERYRLPMPDGSIMHAEFTIGDSILMIGAENLAWGCLSAKTLGGSPIGLCVYVENADVAVEKALAAGMTLEKSVEDQFWGDRTGCVMDSFGYKWTLAQHVEELSPEKIAENFHQFLAKMGC